MFSGTMFFLVNCVENMSLDKRHRIRTGGCLTSVKCCVLIATKANSIVKFHISVFKVLEFRVRTRDS